MNYCLSLVDTATSYEIVSGPFTIKLKDVLIDGNSTIAVEKDGKLRTEYVNIDITFKDMSMDFQNLGLVANVFQSIANSASNVVRISFIKRFMKIHFTQNFCCRFLTASNQWY